MRFSTIFTALFCPYITHERTAQNLILSVRSLLFALFVKERHCSQNQGLLKSEERLSDFKEQCARLWVLVTIGQFLAYRLFPHKVPPATHMFESQHLIIQHIREEVHNVLHSKLKCNSCLYILTLYMVPT